LRLQRKLRRKQQRINFLERENQAMTGGGMAGGGGAGGALSMAATTRVNHEPAPLPLPVRRCLVWSGFHAAADHAVRRRRRRRRRGD
jgi:hypothetical protein